jgi:hypothetical protein
MLITLVVGNPLARELLLQGLELLQLLGHGLRMPFFVKELTIQS